MSTNVVATRVYIVFYSVCEASAKIGKHTTVMKYIVLKYTNLL